MERNPESVREEFEALCQTFTKAEAIYREKVIISRVRVEKIVTGRNDVWAKLVVVPTGGLVGRADDHWSISSNWQTCHFSEHLWSSTYAGWTLYFNPEVVRKTTEMAQSFPETLSGIDLWQQLSMYLGGCMVRAA